MKDVDPSTKRGDVEVAHIQDKGVFIAKFHPPVKSTFAFHVMPTGGEILPAQVMWTDQGGLRALAYRGKSFPGEGQELNEAVLGHVAMVAARAQYVVVHEIKPLHSNQRAA